MQNPISVSTLNSQIKATLQNSYSDILLSGEVSRVTYHASGHVYFGLKDEDAAISAVMWKSAAARLNFRLSEGMNIIVKGDVDVYTPRGTYQIICKSISLDGVGELNKAFSALKEKLKNKGYFDNKKPLPKFPLHVVLITSATSAALQDMLRVAKKRWNSSSLTLEIIDTVVQGANASEQIAQNIKIADAKNADIITLARGGGSIEDLWAFNEEVVADAIFACDTPVVSAIGHEIDYVISDYVADLRAPTPSAAMEMILPDSNELKILLDEYQNQMDYAIKKIIKNKQNELEYAKNSMSSVFLSSKIENLKNELKLLTDTLRQKGEMLSSKKELELIRLKDELKNKAQNLLQLKQNLLSETKAKLQANSYEEIEKKGFVHLHVEGVKADLQNLKKDEEITITSTKTSKKAKII